MIRKTREVFERFHIEIDPNSRISDLSNAYKQQVEIAKAVLENAKVLIMDEPTAPLGNREVENLFEMIRTLKSEGVSVPSGFADAYRKWVEGGWGSLAATP